jgi:hypothetical protein
LEVFTMLTGHRVSWAVPFLFAAGAACGGSDVEDGAFGGNGGTGATSTTTAGQTAQAVAVSSASSTAQVSSGSGASGPGGGDPGSGGGGDGGDGQGGGQGGGGGSDAQGGGSSQGGGGGASPGACDDCDHLAEGDCDEDGDPNDVDCQPCNALAFADQEEFFDEPYETLEGEMSFDYDCSGESELEYAYDADGCSGFNAQACPDQSSTYTGAEPPVCGEQATVQDCEVTGAVVGVAGSCEDVGDPSQVASRCR